MGNQFPDRNGAGLEMGGPSRQLRDYSYSIKRSCFGKKKWSYFFFNVEKICTRFDARGDALLVSELVKPRDGSGGRWPGWGPVPCRRGRAPRLTWHGAGRPPRARAQAPAPRAFTPCLNLVNVKFLEIIYIVF